MIIRNRAISIFFVLAVLSGCASTNVTQQTPMVSPGLARPNQIWIYDFIADPARLPADASIGPGLSAPTTPLTAEELETGRRLGAIIAKQLVTNIQAMGLSAVQAGPGAAPQVGDGVLRGYLVSVHAGSGVTRFVIGFNAGSSEIDTVVEGYEMTAQGLRPVGSGTLSSSGSNARHYRDCDRQSARTDRGWRDEDLWRGERQQYARGESQGDRRRNCRAAEDPIPGARLDKMRVGMRD